MHKAKSKKPKDKSTNKKSKALIIISSFAFFLLTFNFTSNCFAKDKIIAIVNNDVITQKDLNDFINFMRIQLSREYSGQELEKRIETMKVDLLDKLIEDRLILQEAKKTLEVAKTKKDNFTIARLQIDERRVKAKISEIRKRYASDEELQNDLAMQGLVLADIENKIKEQLLMYSIIELKIRSKVLIRPDEVTAFYNKNIKEFISGEALQLGVITLENEDLAKTYSYNLKSGKNPEELALIYPATINKLTTMRGGELKKDVEDVVFNLGVGGISEPIKIEDRYYIFKLDGVIPSRQKTLSEVQDKIHSFIFEEKMRKELTEWLDGIKTKSYIKILEN